MVAGALAASLSISDAEAGEGQKLGTLSSNVAEAESQRLGGELTQIDFEAAPRAQAILTEMFEAAYKSELDRVLAFHTAAMQELIDKKVVPEVDGNLLASNGLLAGLKAESARVQDPMLDVYRYEALITMLDERRDTLAQMQRYYVGVQQSTSAAVATAPHSKEAEAFHAAVKNENSAEERLRALVAIRKTLDTKLEAAKMAADEVKDLNLMEQAEHLYSGYYAFGTNRLTTLTGLEKLESAMQVALEATSAELKELSESRPMGTDALQKFDALVLRQTRLLEQENRIRIMIECLEDLAKVGTPMSGAEVKIETPIYKAGEQATSDEADSLMLATEVAATPECPDASELAFTVTNPFAEITDPVFNAHARAWLTQFDAGFASGLPAHNTKNLDFTPELGRALEMASSNMAVVPTTLYWSRRGSDKVTDDLGKDSQGDLYEHPAQKVWDFLSTECDGPMDTCYGKISRQMIYEDARGERPWAQWSSTDVSSSGQVCPVGQFDGVKGVAGPMMAELCDSTRELLDGDGSCTMDRCEARGQMEGDGVHTDAPYARIYMDPKNIMGVPNVITSMQGPALTEMAWTIARGEVAQELNLGWDVARGAQRVKKNK